MRALQLTGERRELLERPLVVGLRPRPAQPALDEISITLGEVIEDVALLVDLMATSP